MKQRCRGESGAATLPHVPQSAVRLTVKLSGMWRRDAGAVSLPYVVAVLVLAVGVIVAQAMLGVILAGPGQADDGAFATRAILDFRAADGWLFPGWSHLGNAGLGTPSFYFYPPGAYMVASVATDLLDLTPASALSAALLLFRLGALVTCALWLRPHVGAKAGLFGGALYTLMPYVALADPQVRLAFAETAACTLLPLVFRAVDQGRGSASRTIIWLAPAITLMGLTHAPTLVLAGGISVMYAAALTENWRTRVRTLLASTTGVVLGIGMAGATFVPALLLQDAINASAWQPANLGFLLDPDSGNLIRHASLLNWSLIASLIAAGMGIPVALRVRGWAAGLVLLLAVTVVLMLPVSAPLWTSTALPLRRVQFPWRLLTIASLFGAALAAVGLAHLNTVLRRGALLTCFGLAALWIAFAIARGDQGRAGEVRTRSALAARTAQPMEYFPALGWEAWEAVRNSGLAAIREKADGLTGCTLHHSLRAEAVSGGLRVKVAGCSGTILLPQFSFPGWEVQGSASPPTSDPDTGLIRVVLSPGQEEVVLRRVLIWQELAGRLVASATVVIWALLALHSFVARKQLLPSLSARRLVGPMLGGVAQDSEKQALPSAR